jgi:hypothetical protein
LDPLSEGSEELVEITLDGADEVAERAEFYAVGASVGSVQNDGAALLQPAG